MSEAAEASTPAEADATAKRLRALDPRHAFLLRALVLEQRPLGELAAFLGVSDESVAGGVEAALESFTGRPGSLRPARVPPLLAGNVLPETPGEAALCALRDAREPLLAALARAAAAEARPEVVRRAEWTRRLILVVLVGVALFMFLRDRAIP